MEDIKKVFALQWVGPFKTLDDMKSYLKNPNTCDEGLFCFYYFRGKKRGSGNGRKLYNYFGIHKRGSITKRLTQKHEHYKAFFEDDNMRIWIGAFGDPDAQTPRNIEDVETVFIRTYKDFLSENRKKKRSALKETICIINRWYCQLDETPYQRKKNEIRHFDDVLIYEKDINSFRFGSLKNRSAEKHKKNSVCRSH